MDQRKAAHIIESDDIADVQHISVVEEQRQQVAYLKVALNPNKDFLASPELHIRLTNGVETRIWGSFDHHLPIPAFVESVMPDDIPAEEEPALEEDRDYLRSRHHLL